MIKSFGNKLAQDIFFERSTKASRQFPPELYRRARRKLLYLCDSAKLEDLRVPPANRLEALKGEKRGLYSIRINEQWRLIFRWKDGDAHDVAIVDYH